MCSLSTLLLRKRVVKPSSVGEDETVWRRIDRRREVNGREARGRSGITFSDEDGEAVVARVGVMVDCLRDRRVDIASGCRQYGFGILVDGSAASRGRWSMREALAVASRVREYI